MSGLAPRPCFKISFLGFGLSTYSGGAFIQAFLEIPGSQRREGNGNVVLEIVILHMPLQCVHWVFLNLKQPSEGDLN